MHTSLFPSLPPSIHQPIPPGPPSVTPSPHSSTHSIPPLRPALCTLSRSWCRSGQSDQIRSDPDQIRSDRILRVRRTREENSAINTHMTGGPPTGRRTLWSTWLLLLIVCCCGENQARLLWVGPGWDGTERAGKERSGVGWSGVGRAGRLRFFVCAFFLCVCFRVCCSNCCCFLVSRSLCQNQSGTVITRHILYICRSLVIAMHNTKNKKNQVRRH